MTETPSGNCTIYWNDELASELLQFLTGRLKCPETAADLCQETYLRFHQFVQTQPPDNARALAYRIAVNLATDYQRKMKLRDSLTVDVELVTLAEAIKTSSPGPEQTVIAKQHFQRLQTALKELPTDCRTAFLLHGIEGLTYAQIAARLGISESMVYKHLTRAINHCAGLKAEFDDT
jgi:RNA polymerase sigma factor (sigma-70 family)